MTLNKASGGNIILADAAYTISSIVNGNMLSTYTALWGYASFRFDAGPASLAGIISV